MTLSRFADGSDARVDDAAVRQRCRARDMDGAERTGVRGLGELEFSGLSDLFRGAAALMR
jgi:hypothetical protein